MIVLLAAPSAQATNVLQVSCDGTRCGDSGIRDYQYILGVAPSGSTPVTSFLVGTCDPNQDDYTDWIDPPGWTHQFVASDSSLLHTGFFPHGTLASGEAPQCELAILWTGSSVLQPGDSLLFAYDNPNAPHTVTWEDSVGDIADWSQPVAGGIVDGVPIFTNGPVHAPVPEPSTIALLSAGIVSVLAYAWRRRVARG